MPHRNLTLLISYLLIGLFLAGCQGTDRRYSPDGSQEREKVIKILTVNDLHSQIDELPKLYSLVQRIRSSHKYVFLLAAGDLFTGNPLVDRHPDKGWPIIALMNQTGFDASCLGNHEFDLGQQQLSSLVERASFPFVCANITVHSGTMKQPLPYTVLRAGTTEIAVLGLIENYSDGRPSAHPDKLEGLSFRQPLETATEFRQLSEEHDILIALTHIGHSNDVALAEMMPEIDIIAGGHSHTKVSGKTLVNNVLVTQAESHLKWLGEITITVLADTIAGLEYRLLDISEEVPDQDLLERVAAFNAEISLDQVIAYSPKGIPDKESLGSLMADALTAQLDLHMAFQNRGGVRLPSLPAGPVTLKQIYTLDPFDNQPIIYQLYPSEIRALLQASYNRFGSIDLFVSGAEYTVITDQKGKAERVELKGPNGEVPDEKKRYKVGMNSYIASTYSFEHQDPGYTHPGVCSDILAEHLEQQDTLHYYRVRRASSHTKTEY